MNACEICGKRSENIGQAIVEGVLVDVCSSCSKFGKAISVKKQYAEQERKFTAKPRLPEESIVSNYGGIIKKAREEKGLKQDELAKNINERESLIRKIETESLRPSILLAKKLGNFLNVKLVEVEEDEKNASLNPKEGTLTIGDLLKIKDRKV